uniref:Predicted protein n=1 Tax=Hordeum vulgare subsp. vulgare TaxID=112509 RepID=F2EHR9_HORVV|nr:predicted protein [Hordeum vulgare subsp. vulgare]
MCKVSYSDGCRRTRDRAARICCSKVAKCGDMRWWSNPTGLDLTSLMESLLMHDVRAREIGPGESLSPACPEPVMAILSSVLSFLLGSSRYCELQSSQLRRKP